MSKGDTVSKEYLLAEIDDLADEFSEIDENGLHSERWCGIIDAKQIIINAPSMTDRPQGEWLDCGSYYKCPFCEEIELENDGKTNYCPNCGADMRGEQNGDK